MSARVVIDDDRRTIVLGDRSYPYLEVTREDHLHHGVRQCRVTFENGWIASIVWGSCTYSDNYDNKVGDVFVEEPEQVEVAAWPQAGGMVEIARASDIDPEWDYYDTVLGRCDVETVKAFLDVVSKQPSDGPDGVLVVPERAEVTP